MVLHHNHHLAHHGQGQSNTFSPELNNNNDIILPSSSSSSSSRPRASSGVCVRPQTLSLSHAQSSRLRSRSLLRALSSDSKDSKDKEKENMATAMVLGPSLPSSSTSTPTPPLSPFNNSSSFLPRLAAVFGSSSSSHGGVAAGNNEAGPSFTNPRTRSQSQLQQQYSYSHAQAYPLTNNINSGTTLPRRPSSPSTSTLTSTTATPKLSGSGVLTSSSSLSSDKGGNNFKDKDDEDENRDMFKQGGMSSEGTPLSPPPPLLKGATLSSNSPSSSSKLSNAVQPFLPRRRTLSNLFNTFTNSSSGKDKEKETARERSASNSFNVHTNNNNRGTLTLPKDPDLASPVEGTNDNIQTQGWSSSSAIAAAATPPAVYSASSATRDNNNPFAYAFSNGSSGSGNIDSSGVVARPSSPRFKKQQFQQQQQSSHLALTIPPTPGTSTPSLAYTENGNRPLRGDAEDFKLPSPLSEEDHHQHENQYIHEQEQQQRDADREYDEMQEAYPQQLHNTQHRHAYHAASTASASRSNFPPLFSPGYSSSPALSTSFLSSLTNPLPSNIPTLSTQRASRATLSKLLPPIFFLCVSFVVSLIVMYFMISTIPLKIPHNVSEIKIQTVALRDYSRKGLSEGLHVSAVLSALFVFKQAFSVPGSILVNILFGSLYGTYAATICACIFTGVGSVLAYYMARMCAPLVERFMPRALASTRSALLSGTPSDLFSYLLLARLFPLLPYSLLNIACGVLRVPVKPYFITLVLGSFPYNFVTTQLGDLLGNLANSAEAGNINAIWSWDLCFKLAVASILSAAPVVFKEQLKTVIGGGGGSSGNISSNNGTPAQKFNTRFPSSMPSSSSSAFMQEQEDPDVYSLAPLHHAHPEPESNALDMHGLADTSYDNGLPTLRRDRTDSTASEVLYAPPLSAASSASYTNFKRNFGGGAKDSSKRHSKKWSFSWKTLRRSTNNESSASTAASDYSAFSSITGGTSIMSSSSYAPTNSTGRTSIDYDDAEAGDTDEELLREEQARNEQERRRRSSGSSFQSMSSFSRPPSFDYTSTSKHGRRTASIESASSSPTVAQHHHFAFPTTSTSSKSSLARQVVSHPQQHRLQHDHYDNLVQHSKYTTEWDRF